MKYPKVSIIVPAFNEENIIESCIQSLLNLNYPKNRYEILIVDNNSTDATSKIIQKYHNVSYLNERKQGTATTRNLGIKKSKGEILAFIDADCVASKNWLVNLINRFNQNQKIVGVGGEIKALNPRNIIEKYADVYLFDHQNLIEESKNQPPILATGNCAYRAKFIKKMGLFNPSLAFVGDKIGRAHV